jgi:hypothetical protein
MGCLSVKYKLSYESMGFFLAEGREKRKGFLCLSDSEFGIRFLPFRSMVRIPR